MSEETKIQWADTTVNPIMGCGGCELYPSPEVVITAIVEAINEKAPGIKTTNSYIRGVFKKLVDEVFEHSENPHPAHKQTVNTTNIWHLKERFAKVIKEGYSSSLARVASDAIQKSITCYAAVLHLNKGAKILDREGNPPGKDKPRKVHIGHAPIFESVTRFKGRAVETAGFKDLLGTSNPKTPWKDRLPRLIFVSDMGDALSSPGDLPFLKDDLMPAIRSDGGKRHLWLWLTKHGGFLQTRNPVTTRA